MTAENAQIRRLQRSHTSNPTDIANSVRLRAIERRTDSNWPPVNVFDTAPANTLFVFLGIISKPKDLGRWAIDALMSGFDTPSLRVLASIAYTDSDCDEANELKIKVFRELVLPEYTPQNIKKLAIFELEKLEIEYPMAVSPSEAVGRYADLLQFELRARFNYVTCIVNRVDQTHPGTFIMFDGVGGNDDLWEDYLQSLIVEICPYGVSEFSTSYLEEDEKKRIVIGCIEIYLRGERENLQLNLDQFNSKIKRKQ